MKINDGESVALIGPNGAGKSTLLRAISGLVELEKGKIYHDGDLIVESTKSQFRKTGKNKSLNPDEIVKRRIIHCPEKRRLFPQLTVRENLMLGAYVHKEDKRENEDFMYEILKIFPGIEERLGDNAGDFSGGQQQMIAIARSLMARPKILLLDEPSLGLAPLIKQNIIEIIGEIQRRGTTILLVEQDASIALSNTDRAYLLEDGFIEKEGKSADLIHDDYIVKSYLGFG